jgi:hypothetical protein
MLWRYLEFHLQIKDVYIVVKTAFASDVVKCNLVALCFYLSSLQVLSFVLDNLHEVKAIKRYN